MALYDKPVHALMKSEMIHDLDILPGQPFSKGDVLAWFQECYPKVKESTITAHLVKLSTNAKTRVYYKAKPNGDDDRFFQIDGSTFRLYEPGSDPAPIYTKEFTSIEAESESTEDIYASQFAYEHDLRDYLAKNLSLLEPGLKLYEDEANSGIEFPVGGRYIDILAVDAEGRYVVIELKVSKGYDRVIGQILRYMAWIEKHHAEDGQTTRGIIVAKEISEDLRLACSKTPAISLFEYDLSVSLRKIT